MMAKSPDLEVISSDPHSIQNQLERRRLPRISLPSDQFRLAQTGKVFSILDLSEQGMGIRVLDANDRILFVVGAKIEGTLSLRREKLPIQARVCRVTADQIGCEFETVPAETAEALRRLLDPEELGQGLQPIPISDTDTLWFHGPSGTDLLFRRGRDEKFYRFSIYIMGNYVHWDANDGLATGRTEPGSDPCETRGVFRFETMLLDQDEKVDPGKLAIAKKLVLSSNLPQDLRQWCASQISEGNGNGS